MLLFWCGTQCPGESGLLYNFGVTSFNQENYIQKFIGGRVDFWVNARTYAPNLRWQKADRTVVRYPLNLDPIATRQLIQDLEHAVVPKTVPFYDTFRANCAINCVIRSTPTPYSPYSGSDKRELSR